MNSHAGQGGLRRAGEVVAVFVAISILGLTALWSLNPQWGKLPLPGLAQMTTEPFVAWVAFATALVMVGLLLNPRYRDRDHLTYLAGFMACFGMGLAVFLSVGSGLVFLLISAAASDKANRLGREGVEGDRNTQ
ncbi:MAG: hypothetical protein Q4G70_10065 [Pseudomonadota bacterium]|nr:hypothetical protein [Pseudomonadota bacterium]